MSLKLSKRVKLSLLFVLGLSFFMFTNPAPVIAIGGNITLTNDNVISGSTIGIQLTNLDASTAYAVYRGSTNLGNFTTGALETSKNFITQVTKGTTSIVVIYLYSGSTTVDQASVVVSDVLDLIPQALIIAFGIALLVMVIIVTVVAGFMYKRKNE